MITTYRRGEKISDILSYSLALSPQAETNSHGNLKLSMYVCMCARVILFLCVWSTIFVNSSTTKIKLKPFPQDFCDRMGL